MRIVLAAATAALLASGANAAVSNISYLPGVFGAPGGFTLVNDFNTAAEQALVTGSDFIFTTGTTPGLAVAVPGNDTPFLAVLGGGTANLSFTTPVRSFAFDFSTLDTYNLLTINYATGPSQSLTGDDFLAAGAASGVTSGSFRVRGDGRLITGLTLGSTSNSFEVDNLSATSAVPEPATWAMMILGFGLVGAAARRRTGAVARVSA